MHHMSIQSRTIFQVITVFALASVSRGQGFCFEVANQHAIGVHDGSFVLADFDGDGDVDIAVSRPALGTIELHKNVAHPVWAPPSSTSVSVARSLGAADFNGDGTIDIACLANGTPTVLFNAGDGTFTPQVVYTPGTPPLGALTLGDFSGDSAIDMIARREDGAYFSGVRLTNSGTGTFTATSISLPPFNNGKFRVGQLNGARADFVVAEQSLPRRLIVGFDGAGIGTAVAGSADVQDCTLGDFDADGDLDIAAVTNPSPALMIWHNDGTGAFTFVTSSPLAAFAHLVRTGDFDGDGRSDLIVTQTASGPTLIYTESVAGTLVQTGSVAASLTDPIDARCFDVDQDGDLDFVLSNWLPGSIQVARNCRVTGSVTCAGDGSGAACPCANTSPPLSGQGCATSSTTGGALRGSGSAVLSNDALSLSATNMPTGTFAMFIQGDFASAGGAGAAFGDGLLCTAGAIVRLALKSTSFGAANYPGVGDPAIGAAGAVLSSGERIYQVWFRDAGAFCTSDNFDLTNGLAVLWSP